MNRNLAAALVIVLGLLVVLVVAPQWFMTAMGALIFVPLAAIALLTGGVWVARKLRI